MNRIDEKNTHIILDLSIREFFVLDSIFSTLNLNYDFFDEDSDFDINAKKLICKIKDIRLKCEEEL